MYTQGVYAGGTKSTLPLFMIFFGILQIASNKIQTKGKQNQTVNSGSKNHSEKMRMERTCNLHHLLCECRLVLKGTIEHFIVGVLRGLFIEALGSLVHDILELMAMDPLDITADTILQTLGNIGLGLVSIIRHVIRIIVAAVVLAVLCCMDVAVGSLRISMCLVDLCFDVIEVLLGRLMGVDSRVFPILHVAFLSFLVFLVFP